jgi:hypothetical protein
MTKHEHVRLMSTLYVQILLLYNNEYRKENQAKENCKPTKPTQARPGLRLQPT